MEGWPVFYNKGVYTIPPEDEDPVGRFAGAIVENENGLLQAWKYVSPKPLDLGYYYDIDDAVAAFDTHRQANRLATAFHREGKYGPR